MKQATSTVYNVLINKVSLPDHMYIGADCCHKHGQHGQTLRYKSNNNCIICQGKTRRSVRKKFLAEGRNINALRAYENRLEQAAHDVDPLFD